MKPVKKLTSLLFSGALVILVAALFGPVPGALCATGSLALMFAPQAENVLGMNLANINRLAEDADFTSYEGDFAQNAYTGYGDDFLSFEGAQKDFATELATKRIFSFTISNTTGSNHVVLLNPSYLPSSTKIVADGTIGGVSGLSASGSPKTIANFLAFVKDNPMRVLVMKVTSNYAPQLSQVIDIKTNSPFRDLETDMIDLNSFTTETAFNDKMVTVRRAFQLDNQTEVSLLIPGSMTGDTPNTTTTTITLYCGAVLNTAAALNSKATRAAKNPQVQVANQLIAAK